MTRVKAIFASLLLSLCLVSAFVALRLFGHGEDPWGLYAAALGLCTGASAVRILSFSTEGE